MKTDKPLYKKKDIWLIIGILSLALFSWCILKFVNVDKDSVKAEIYCNNVMVKSINLTKAEDEIFSVKERPHILFEIKDHQIRFMDSDCPDKICIKSGFLSKNGESAVCMPNKTVLKIVGKDSDMETDVMVK